MGFSVEEYSGLVMSHLIYKAALLCVVVRWVLRLVGLISQEEYSVEQHETTQPQQLLLQCQRRGDRDRDRDRDSLLQVMSYEDIYEKLQLPESSHACAVCLNVIRKRDKVRQLRNCCHVFHRKCIDRWIDHDDRVTCPLCRAPLLHVTSSSSRSLSEPPSWAVERLLYLFGDDLF